MESSLGKVESPDGQRVRCKVSIQRGWVCSHERRRAWSMRGVACVVQEEVRKPVTDMTESLRSDPFEQP